MTNLTFRFDRSWRVADEILLAGLPMAEDLQRYELSIDDIGSIGDALADPQDGYAPMYRTESSQVVPPTAPACCCCCV